MNKILLLVFVLVSLCIQDIFAQPNGRRADINDPSFTAVQISNLATAMYNYIDAAVIQEHDCNTEFYNHNGNSSGEHSWSIHGREMFMNWHREYLVEMEAAIQTELNAMGLTLLPRWNPANGIGGNIPSFIPTDPDCANTHCTGFTDFSTPCSNPSGFPNGVSTTFPSALMPTLNCSNWSDANAFTSFVNFGYHPVGHIAGGGVMADFKSPASPLFWLWHGMVDDVYWDYQQDCQPNAELRMEDNTSDTGAEPSSGTLYLSHDIWVRLYQDTKTGPATPLDPTPNPNPNSNPANPFAGLTQHPYGSENFMMENDDFDTNHENPYHSPVNPNYVYVRIRNNSTQEFSGGRLHVYWSKASTGLSWPTTWVNYAPGGLLHGDEILPSIAGQIPTESNFIIPPISAGGQFIMEVPWYTVPNPDDFPQDGEEHHFCLLARIVSSHDPMTVTEGSALWSNVKENNNIVWKNVSIYYDPMIFAIVGGNGGNDPEVVDKYLHFAGVYVTNATEGGELTHLTIAQELGEEDKDYFEQGGAVYTRIDDALFNVWKEGGLEGTDVKYIGMLNKKHYIRVFSSKATLNNLYLPGESKYTMEMGFALEEEIEPQNFKFDVQQFNEKGIVGGERYDVRVRGEKDGKFATEKVELRSSITDVVISPNPAASSFIATYRLSNISDVRFTFSDVKGRIISDKTIEKQVPGENQESFDVSNLTSGIYLLKVYMGSEVIVKKVIVE